MLTEYIDGAMSKAVYDKLDDNSFSGTIPECKGVVAFGETLFQCQKELRSSLEGWLIVKIRHGDDLPVIGRLDLNKKMPSAQREATVHGHRASGNHSGKARGGNASKSCDSMSSRDSTDNAVQSAFP